MVSGYRRIFNPVIYRIPVALCVFWNSHAFSAPVGAISGDISALLTLIQTDAADSEQMIISALLGQVEEVQTTSPSSLSASVKVELERVRLQLDVTSNASIDVRMHAFDARLMATWTP